MRQFTTSRFLKFTHKLVNLELNKNHTEVYLMVKKLIFISVVTGLLGTCGTTIEEGWNHCHSQIRNEHAGNLACAFHGIGYILAHPYLYL